MRKNTFKGFTPEDIDAIPGIDAPLIDPSKIPEGCVQSFDELHGEWRLRKEGQIHFITEE